MTPRHAPDHAATCRPVRLSPRQRECLGWTQQGKSSRDIATILGLSPRTVEEHIAEACRKLGVRTRTQAVLVAFRRGLLDDPDADVAPVEGRSF